MLNPLHVWLCLSELPTATAAAAKSLQSCPTLWDPRDGSPPGSPVPGILQARTLEWVAISFSNAWKWKVKVKSLSRIRLLATPWTAAHQAPPSMGFSRQEYWSGVPVPSPSDLPRKVTWLAAWVGRTQASPSLPVIWINYKHSCSPPPGLCWTTHLSSSTANESTLLTTH